MFNGNYLIPVDGDKVFRSPRHGQSELRAIKGIKRIWVDSRDNAIIKDGIKMVKVTITAYNEAAAKACFHKGSPVHHQNFRISADEDAAAAREKAFDQRAREHAVAAEWRAGELVREDEDAAHRVAQRGRDRVAVALVGADWKPSDCRQAGLRALHRSGCALRFRWLCEAVEAGDASAVARELYAKNN